MPEQSLLNTCIFSIGSTFTRQHFSAVFGGHFKWQNHQEKAQRCETCGTEYIVKKTTVYRFRVETRRENITLCYPSWDCACQVAQTLASLSMSINGHKSAPRINFGLTTTF